MIVVIMLTEDDNLCNAKSPVGARRTKTDIHLPNCGITRQVNQGSPIKSKVNERSMLFYNLCCGLKF